MASVVKPRTPHNLSPRFPNIGEIWRLVAVVLCFAVVPARSADLPPDPSQLEAGWWDYFVASEEQGPDVVATHVEITSERLGALKAQFLAGDQSKLAALADTVISSLRRYQKFSAEPLPLPPMAKPAQESYSLIEIRSLIAELRKAGVKFAEENQEIELLENAIAAGQRDLNQQKVDYRALPDSSPKRTQEGLELMQSRLQMELGKLELAWRRAGNKSLERQIENLGTLVEAAARRLTATEEAIQNAAKERVASKERAEKLRLKFLRAQLAQSGTLALSAGEKARGRLATQRLLGLDVQASREEIVAAQHGLVEAILQRIMAGNESDPEPDREYLSTYEDELGKVETKVPEWRKATARSRETALTRIPDESDEELVALLELRATVADETERELRTLEEQLIGAAQFGDLLDSLLAQRESRMARGIQAAEDLAGSSWEQVMRWIQTSLFEIGGTPVTAIDIFRMLVILTIAWWVSKLVRRALQGIAAKRQSVNTGSIYTLSRILHYIILAVGIMIALSSIGIDFTKFALFASALGVGIGFGLQTLVSNFVAGLIILFEKSLKIGDFVELESGVTGEVREINMRSTLVTTNDNIDIVVPNSEFVNGRVTNWTMREAYRRVHIPFGVAYGTDKELVRKAALEAANDVSLTLTTNRLREPQLWFVEFGDSSLNFELVVWLNPDAVKRPGAVNARYLWEIDDKLRKYAIEVPFPQRDLHLRSVLGKTAVEDIPLAGRPPTSGS
jgi:small-conductance mechanosensitive channel